VPHLQTLSKTHTLATLLIDGIERLLLVAAIDLVHLEVLGHLGELGSNHGIRVDAPFATWKDAQQSRQKLLVAADDAVEIREDGHQNVIRHDGTKWIDKQLHRTTPYHITSHHSTPRQ
jgi:hypothetical protein